MGCELLPINLYQPLLTSALYVALSFVDNGYAFAILAYDNKGRMVKRIDKRGARYVNRIELEKDIVTFFGQADHSVTFRLRDLAVV